MHHFLLVALKIATLFAIGTCVQWVLQRLARPSRFARFYFPWEKRPGSSLVVRGAHGAGKAEHERRSPRQQPTTRIEYRRSAK